VRDLDWAIDDHLAVRSLEPGDAEMVFALIEGNRMHLRPWMPWELTTRSAADTRGFIERAVTAEDDLEGNGIFVDGELVGAIGMRIDPLNDAAEIGYWLDAGHQGRGIVTRVASRFVEHAFSAAGVHRVEIKAAVENRRSRAVAERLGFREEATLREALKTSAGYMDAVVYGMLADEWPG